jgi:hypothetical protein
MGRKDVGAAVVARGRLHGSDSHRLEADHGPTLVPGARLLSAEITGATFL